ncbi:MULTISPECIES: EAL domain-containing protein [unclassified Pseudomonas]|uniref:EAL domain-containing protein n=1 Tax=unclassified Pseudomonas TaxID=196821 RepID=UPI00083957C9|nr:MULTISPECIES: EAL domain-containing protein [unclassified Pseudomonas]QIH08275.1 EAL domain-containing protein [Pseudomonas sp. BIOMIG1BAC]
MSIAVSPQLLTVDEVRRGLHRREFQAYVQPKFNLRSHQVPCVEVLARWHHPLRGLLGPATFLPLMGHGWLLDELLCSLLDQGLACQLELHRQGREMGFAFNLSLHQLVDEGLVDRLEARLQAHPLSLSAVTLEITEDAGTHILPVVTQRILRLKRLGVRLSMDDFGTGHSSLWRLCQLPFDEIKLAGEFTRQLTTPGRAQAIVGHARTLAEELGMELIVEGIETRAQRSILMGLGVRFGQGYLCARPMSLGALGGWLEQPPSAAGQSYSMM